MYIEPNTDIRLLNGIKIDSNYENSIWFNSVSHQIDYFISKTKHNLTDQYFQRVTRGVARVQIPIGQLYDCDYMMFRNTSFSGKWFYAFIDNVEYINNSVSEIRYTLDVIQSWLFDYRIYDTFIERNHSLTDEIGDNILPERVELGEYVFNSYETLTPRTAPTGVIPYTTMCYIMEINDVTVDEAFAGIYDGILSGSQLWAFDRMDIDGIQTKISQYVRRGKPDAIRGLYVCPLAMIGSGVIELGGTQLPSGAGATEFDVLIKEASRVGNNLDGYTPKNNKMFTYPYNMLRIETGEGNGMNLRYEFFEDIPKFHLNGTICQPPTITARPMEYKNVDFEKGVSTEQLSLSQYPMCNWVNDAYQAWVAQNAIPLLMSGLTNLVGAGFAAYQGYPSPTGILGQSMNVLAQQYRASIMADVNNGNRSNGSGNVASQTQTFYTARMSVNRQYAKMIDDYFTMFGYAQNQIGNVRREVRPHWTYVKTIGCQGTGAVPNEDAKAIDKIYDKGIRFWKDNDEIGDYTLDNSPN